MNESCVRIYDNVVSDQWCKDTINLFEKSKNPSDDNRYESPDFNQVTSQTKSFTEICIENKDEWINVKNTFINACPQHFHKFIKDIVQSSSKNNFTPNVLYGGSVTSKNAEVLFKEKYIDGALIGGASLNGKEFAEIANIFKNRGF